MDERLPVDEALGIHVDTPAGGGDAHCFRNAGGIVTDDAIRSAILTCHFFGTKEIVIVQHTQCGMLSANATDLENMLPDKGIDTDNIAMDPTLPELKLEKGAFAKWIWMMDDVDETCMKTIEAFKNHPLIPKNVVINGWVWEVETRRLRAPTRDPENGQGPMPPQPHSASKGSNRLVGGGRTPERFPSRTGVPEGGDGHFRGFLPGHRRWGPPGSRPGSTR